MTEIIGVRFRSAGKVYYFSPKGEKLSIGDRVIVETSRGVECGEVVIANRGVGEDKLVAPVKEIIRTATPADLKTVEQNRAKEKNAMKVCQEKIAAHKLNMKLVDVECTFDNNKMLFYFTAESRVDFRELVKDLASVFRTRIELRQIGVRDEAKMLGGLGVCGRPFCCKAFLGDFQPVSIKMAKEQGLSLNPTKISGTCGRLMCCLKYEQDCYEELLKVTPKVGAYVKTPDFKGYVEEVNLLTGMLKVKREKSDDAPISISKDEVEVIRDGKIRVDKDEIRALRGLEDK
ncbi:MAG: stage 0 sporulation family protein [Oscillospiraceae bacterium]